MCDILLAIFIQEPGMRHPAIIPELPPPPTYSDGKVNLFV